MERWGEKFKDKRDWISYNERMIKKGEWFFDFTFLESIGNELEEMNKCKVDAVAKGHNKLLTYVLHFINKELSLIFSLMKSTALPIVEILFFIASFVLMNNFRIV